MRLSDLRDKPICTLDGERLGRVHEVHCDGGKIVALKCGAGSWIERLTGKNKGTRIDWARVKRVTADAVVVGPAAGEQQSSAARTPPGTRRSTVRRSKR